MPVYEYECRKCGEKFDIRFGTMNMDEEVKCPVCGSSETERVYSVFGGGANSSCAPSRSSFG